MQTVIAIFAVLFGLTFGSFLNVCISRLPAGESVIAPRSRCPGCKQPIRSRDNIPLLSWALLSGRCRDCGAAIPLRYPLVEAATAAFFLLCFLKFGPTLAGAGAAVFCFLLVGLAAMDAETFLLPDAFTLPGIALGILFSSLAGGEGAGGTWLGGHGPVLAAAWAALCAVAAATLILLIRWIYGMVRQREGMGLGDVKLCAMIAAWSRPSGTLLVFFLAVVAGSLFGLGLILTYRLPTRSNHGLTGPDRVPFGAFLCLGALANLFIGGRLVIWYLHFFP